MNYLTTMEQRADDVVSIKVFEANAGAKTVVLLSCLRGTERVALTEALRVAFESLELAGTG